MASSGLRCGVLKIVELLQVDVSPWCGDGECESGVTPGRSGLLPLGDPPRTPVGDLPPDVGGGDALGGAVFVDLRAGAVVVRRNTDPVGVDEIYSTDRDLPPGGSRKRLCCQPRRKWEMSMRWRRQSPRPNKSWQCARVQTWCSRNRPSWALIINSLTSEFISERRTASTH